jgi:hypothetical protein
VHADAIARMGRGPFAWSERRNGESALRGRGRRCGGSGRGCRGRFRDRRRC